MDRSHELQAPTFLPVLSPVMTREKFAELSGLTEGVIQGMIEKGHLPSVKIGRHRLVNLIRLTETCVNGAFAP